MKWFRFWNDMPNDVKILQLSDYEYRIWTYLLSFASSADSVSGELQVTFKLLSLHFHQRFNLFSRAIETFQKVGLITINEKGFIVITNWNKRQFKSDNSYDRVKKFREVTSKRNVSCNVFETPPDTDTDTDTEKENTFVVKDDPDKIPFREIISHLNGKTGMSFKATTTKTKSLIRSRWIEGFRLADFKAVIDRMADEWGADSKMMVYLRPVTLFGPKFEGYLNRPEKKDYGDKEPF